MTNKRKADDADIPGAGQPRTRAARTGTTAGDATAAGVLQALPVRPGAPLQFSGAARGGGGGSGSGRGGLAPPLGNPGGAPTAGGTAARVTPPATVNAVGFLDASSQFGGALGRGGASGSGLGGFLPPHWRALPTPTIPPPPVPAYTGGAFRAPAAYATRVTRPPFLPALGHGGGGNPVPVTTRSLIAASRRRFFARRQQRNASAPQGHRGQSSSAAPEQQSSSGGVYVDGVLYDRAAWKQHLAIRAKLDEDLKTVSILTKDKPFSISRRCETCGTRACTVHHHGGPPPPPPPPPAAGLC